VDPRPSGTFSAVDDSTSSQLSRIGRTRLVAFAMSLVGAALMALSTVSAWFHLAPARFAFVLPSYSIGPSQKYRSLLLLAAAVSAAGALLSLLPRLRLLALVSASACLVVEARIAQVLYELEQGPQGVRDFFDLSLFAATEAMDLLTDLNPARGLYLAVSGAAAGLVGAIVTLVAPRTGRPVSGREAFPASGARG
jgi:hypothetical protein